MIAVGDGSIVYLDEPLCVVSEDLSDFFTWSFSLAYFVACHIFELL